MDNNYKKDSDAVFLRNNLDINYNELSNPLDINNFPFGPISSLVSYAAPDFTAPAVMIDNSVKEDFNLKSYLKNSYGLIFFYPADFTFVCPTELIAHNNRIKEFEKRNVKIVGISVDSIYAHIAWKNMPLEKGGIGNLQFPLISDINKNISQNYRVLNQEGLALRASFILDSKGIIRHQLVNDLPVGRNADETLRIIDALQFTEKEKKVCPANWRKGDDGIEKTIDDIADFLSKNAEKL